MVSIRGDARSKLRSRLGELAQMRSVEFETALEDEVTAEEPDIEPAEDEEPDIESAEDEELEIEPVALNGDESPLVREVLESGLIAEGMRRRMEADGNGGQIDCSEMEHELQRIYEIAGAPSAFGEALGKVEALADDLTMQADCRPDEALYIAYRRSLTEHREYLIAKGIYGN